MKTKEENILEQSLKILETYSKITGYGIQLSISDYLFVRKAAIEESAGFFKICESCEAGQNMNVTTTYNSSGKAVSNAHILEHESGEESAEENTNDMQTFDEPILSDFDILKRVKDEWN